MFEYFINYGFRSNNMLNLSPHEAFEMCNNHKALILDVREAYMNRFKMFGVPEVLYCPRTILEQNFDNIPRNIPVVIADASGLHSCEAYKILENCGFRNIANLAGGLVEWERAQLPLEIDSKNRLSGSCLCQLKFRERE